MGIINSTLKWFLARVVGAFGFATGTLKPEMHTRTFDVAQVISGSQILSFFDKKTPITPTKWALTLLVNNPHTNTDEGHTDEGRYPYQHTQLVLEFLVLDQRSQKFNREGLLTHFIYDNKSAWFSIGKSLFGKGLVVGRGMDTVGLLNLSCQKFEMLTISIDERQGKNIKKRVDSDMRGRSQTYSKFGWNTSGSTPASHNCFTYCCKLIKDEAGINLRIPWWLWRRPIVLPSTLLAGAAVKKDM